MNEEIDKLKQGMSWLGEELITYRVICLKKLENWWKLFGMLWEWVKTLKGSLLKIY